MMSAFLTSRLVYAILVSSAALGVRSSMKDWEFNFNVPGWKCERGTGDCEEGSGSEKNTNKSDKNEGVDNVENDSTVQEKKNKIYELLQKCNHLVARKNQPQQSPESPEPVEVAKQKEKENERSLEQVIKEIEGEDDGLPGRVEETKYMVSKGKEKENDRCQQKERQPECKNHSRKGRRKFGNDSRHNHPQEKHVVGPPLEFNFLGLPIRPGEKECQYYMRTGSCKYATNCWFHHPDPTTAEDDFLYICNNSVSTPLCSLGSSEHAPTSFSLPRTSNETISYMETSSSYVSVPFPEPQGLYQNSEWNSCQCPQEGNIRSPSVVLESNITKIMDGSSHQQKMPIEEGPVGPNPAIIRTHNRMCKNHHPKNRAPKLPVCNLSPMGLPLRPGHNICRHYKRNGNCGFGPDCKFHHPVNCNSQAS
ncbi:PREDICTED: zinc finger CCCH domain-containing protein 43-like isoform X2 [Nelumbo nucifera]|uniref:Zinc finger CCCH domain-containing protein 43-like isoform X2 n=1 Tax=Nelumbo nucifera TaxID=4432 RepID=A0A1U7Z5H5_NELNU|nr:PREDICTED: zinc finger CCCH domain-containing protein 43-like isoform X2 [Nelumbo nucifera]